MKRRFDMSKTTSRLFPYIVGTAILAVTLFFTDYLWTAVFASVVSLLLIGIILVGIIIELKQDHILDKKDQRNGIYYEKQSPSVKEQGSGK